MEFNMKERKKIAQETVKSYAIAGKKEKSNILNGFISLTGYSRKYAISLLNSQFKIHSGTYDGHPFKSVKIIKPENKSKRVYKKTYGHDVSIALSGIWRAVNFMCGQRLVCFIRENIDSLASEPCFGITPPVREKLAKTSSATIDRLLKRSRAERLGKGMSTTRPGTELNRLIPIRTFFDWDERVPGFFETDTVSHDGGNASGEHCYTVDMTDVCTGWTELRAVKNKAQTWVVEAIKDIKCHIPYKMKGIDSDNGSEFKNRMLYEWCQSEGIDFTRIRPYRKNDNCFVEQKNDSLVRKLVGYYRYEGEEMTDKMNEIYRDWCLLVNYFYPSMKLVSKERRDAKVKKRYDMAKSPYRRTMESELVSEEDKAALAKRKEGLNFLEISRRMSKNITGLLELAGVIK